MKELKWIYINPKEDYGNMKKWKISVKNQESLSFKTVACIGYFDGLHIGHKALIDKAVQIAKEKNIESALITFDPDPWVTVRGETFVQHLNTMEEREAIAEKYGIQNWIVMDFTKEMSQLSPIEFIHCLTRCNLDTLVCGFDYHYGAFGKGNASTLIDDSKGLFNVVVIDSVDQGGEKISTTRITSLIKEGNIEKANELLNYEYSISGIVKKGHRKGSKIGFPTANLEIEKEYVLPKCGVYAGKAVLENQEYDCMINIGHNPTFNYSEEISIEAYLFNFCKNIYHQKMKLKLIKRIRDEKKFSNVKELIEQLNQDSVTVQGVLK